MNVELLRSYKAQNPRKFILKFGDVTPEEAAEKLKPSMPFHTGAVKVEITGKEEVEVGFKEVEVATETEFNLGELPAEAVEEKPKKTRKVK